MLQISPSNPSELDNMFKKMKTHLINGDTAGVNTDL